MSFAVIRKKLSYIYLVLCFASFILLDVSFRYIYTHVFGEGTFSGDAVIFTVSWATMLTAIIALIPGMFKRVIMMLIITVFGVLTVAHASMYSIFHNFLSFADVMYAGDGARFFSFTYLNIRKLLIVSVLFSIGLMAVAAWLAPKRRAGGKVIIPIIAVVLIIAAGSTILTYNRKLMISGNKEQMSWSSALRSQSDGTIYSDFTNVNQSMRISGLYQYTARNLVVSTGLEQWFQTSSTHNKLDDIFSELRSQNSKTSENHMTGKFAGKNVMMIMLESVDSWLITEEYMPNLYGVYNDSIRYTNFYSPSFINAATFNSEFIALTGLIPPTAGIKQSAYTTNNFSLALPYLFKEQGYSVNSFHSAEAVIYDRGNIHKNLGFSAYHSHYNMGMSDYMRDSQLINGYPKMVSQEPFFSFIITFSGHGPYTEEMSNISDPHYERAVAAAQANGVTGSEKNLNEYYYAVAHAMETDAFVGSLLEKLETDGLLQDTVLIFFADHYSKYLTDTQFIMDLKGAHSIDLLANTPFFIYNKDTEPSSETKYTSTIDIYPTIANLFGLETDLIYFVGDDMFGDKGNYVMFRNYAWYDGEIYYSDEYKGELTEAIAERSIEVRYRTNLSWDTMSSDYFKTLGRIGK